MQKIRSILKIGNSGAALCDEYGATSGTTLELMLGTGCLLEFELRGDAAGESAVLPDYPLDELTPGGYYCAFDFSCGNRSDPPLLILDGVTLAKDAAGRTVFTVPLINNACAEISEALTGKNTAELFCELGGFDGDGRAVFAWQFKVIVRSRVYYDDGSATQFSQPPYYTAVQVDALVSGLEERLRGEVFSAGNIGVSDPGNYFVSGNVEDVLQEIGMEISGAAEELENI